MLGISGFIRKWPRITPDFNHSPSSWWNLSFTLYCFASEALAGAARVTFPGSERSVTHYIIHKRLCSAIGHLLLWACSGCLTNRTLALWSERLLWAQGCWLLPFHQSDFFVLRSHISWWPHSCAMTSSTFSSSEFNEVALHSSHFVQKQPKCLLWA